MSKTTKKYSTLQRIPKPITYWFSRAQLGYDYGTWFFKCRWPGWFQHASQRNHVQSSNMPCYDFWLQKVQFSTLYCYKPPYSSKVHKKQYINASIEPLICHKLQKETQTTAIYRKNWKMTKQCFYSKKVAKDCGCILQNFNRYVFRNIIQYQVACTSA